jgi:hypothetical protein
MWWVPAPGARWDGLYIGGRSYGGGVETNASMTGLGGPVFGRRSFSFDTILDAKGRALACTELAGLHAAWLAVSAIKRATLIFDSFGCEFAAQAAAHGASKTRATEERMGERVEGLV